MKQDRNQTAKWEYAICALYFALYCVICLSLLFKQPFGNPPDEHNRYLIPQYIAEHGTLPNGYDETIRISGYGFSYAFQPILPYMAQGCVLRIASVFTSDADKLLYAARMVNFLFGFIMAYFVLLLGRKWFRDKRFQYLFSYLVMFLPQSIFLHTYVNTDSCCMLSIAVMLYGLTLCLEDNFSCRSSILLSVGIILCALSYYNAYGYILSCILLFFANFLSIRQSRPQFDFYSFLKKGIFISALVLLGIAWWFVRSYLLYDGDFLGLRARDNCALLYAAPELKPGFRITYESQGFSLWEMIRTSDFMIVSLNSLICAYGPMTVVTSVWIYRFYKLFFLVTLPLCALLSGKLRRKLRIRGGLWQDRPALRIFFHMNMVFCILMPCILSLYYSYHTDYQPQGRYILPILIPLCYYCVRGLDKGWQLLTGLVMSVSDKKADKKGPASSPLTDSLLTGLFVILMTAIVLSLCITVYGYAYPYYNALNL